MNESILTPDGPRRRVGITVVLATAFVAAVLLLLLMLLAGEARAAQQTISTPAESFKLNRSTDGEIRAYSWARDGKLWRITGNLHLTKDISVPGEISQIRMWAAASTECGTRDIELKTRKWTGGSLGPVVSHGARNAIAQQMSWLEWNVNLPAGRYRVIFQRECSDNTVLSEDHVEINYATSATSPTAPAPKEVACNLANKIANAARGATIDGAGCVAREAVNITKPLTLKNLVVKGTNNWSGNFTAAGNNYRSSKTVPALVEPGQTSDPLNTQLCESADTKKLCAEAEMVFLNGKYLLQLPDGSDPGPEEFALDANRRVVLGENPGSGKVEVAVRQQGITLRSGSGGTVLDNVDVGQVANTVGQKGTGAAVKNQGNALTIRNSEYSYTHGSALGCGGGVRCTITGSEVHHAGEAGVGSYKASPLVFTANKVYDNCSALADANYNDSFNCSGIKITGESPNGRTVSGNEFFRNDHAGVWTDVRANNTVIENNRIHHNEEKGMHIEISNGITIRDNVLWENGWVGTPGTTFNSSDIYLSDSGGVKVYRNVMAWSRDGLSYIGGTRNSTNAGNEVYDNDIILGANDAGNKQILSGWLPRGDNLGSNVAHDNRYYYGGLQDGNATRKFQWNTTTYAKLADYNATPGAQKGRFLSATEVQSVLRSNNVPTGPQR